MSELFEDTLIDDFNFLRGYDVPHDTAVMFFTGIDGATNIAPDFVGGGNNDDGPCCTKDVSKKEYVCRCVRWAHHNLSPVESVFV